jgi:peptide deformylase
MPKTRPIVLQPHPTLTRRAESAVGATADVLATLEDMLATLYRADGIGLAAPQIDVSQRLVVMDLGVEGEDGKRHFNVKKPLFLINPEITWKSEETAVRQEGCLSLPGLWGDVERPAAVKVRYTDRDGQVVEQEAQGLLAVCLQHEIDHLDGVLFPERMSKLRRDLAMKKWAKLRKELLEDGGEFDVFSVEKGLIKGHRDA